MVALRLPLLGKSIPVDRRYDVPDDQWLLVKQRLETFVEPINAAELDNDQRNVVLQTAGIVVFRKVQHKVWTMTRSFMDLEPALFHWHVDDLTHRGYSTPERIATYYFHDAYHVYQHRQGDQAEDDRSLIRREVEATNAQIAFADLINVDDVILNDLRDFATDETRIKERIRNGASRSTNFFNWLLGRPRYEAHFKIL